MVTTASVEIHLPSASLAIVTSTSSDQASRTLISTASLRPQISTNPWPFPLPKVVDPWTESSLVKSVLEGNINPLSQAVETAKNCNSSQINDLGVLNANNFLLSVSESAHKSLAPLGDWTVRFAEKVGDWMSTSGSITEQASESFQNSPKYNYDEAVVPPDGWQNFNQLFARHLKKGMRPISAGNPNNAKYDRVVVYPADSTFDGAWQIDEEEQVNIKGLEWKISDLLQSSQYSSYFKGGIWMHAFLNTFDYHMQHAPVGGTAVEANVIQSLAYMQVVADEDTGELKPHRSCVSKEPKPTRTHGLFDTLDAPDEAGYQFLQARGCIIIKNELLGHVAVLPIGMAQVSSVKLAWEPKRGEKYPIHPNVKINKGDEISHFEFGGSDIVLVFQKDADIQILGAQGIDANNKITSKQKYLVGMPLGYSTKGLSSMNGKH